MWTRVTRSLLAVRKLSREAPDPSARQHSISFLQAFDIIIPHKSQNPAGILFQGFISMKSGRRSIKGAVSGANKRQACSKQGKKEVFCPRATIGDQSPMQHDIHERECTSGNVKKELHDIIVKVEDRLDDEYALHTTFLQREGEELLQAGYMPLLRPSKSDDNGQPMYVHVDKDELTLEFTMNIGQSFRWLPIDSEDSTYVGVLGDHVIALKHDTHPFGVSHVWYKILGHSKSTSNDYYIDIKDKLEEYFNLREVHLSEMSKLWAADDSLFREIVKEIPGARMLRQDPVECLFAFICSQNNHISRIHGMVNRLAGMYGNKIDVDDGAPEIVRYKELYGNDSAFYSFPGIEALREAREEDLRNAGFGYRAKFIEGTAKMLHEMPGGGRSWLMRLRDATFEDSLDELCMLPGVGPKVAACVALFSLDKHSSIPVDTHVWQLSLRHYTPHLRGKTNSPKYHPEVQAAFINTFGEYAGWAHNTLFISELASVQKKLHARRLTQKEPEHHTPPKRER